MKSLLWFETKKDKKTGDLNDDISTIEQGTVVQIKNNELAILVFEVWKTNTTKGSKGRKWFPIIHKKIVKWQGQKGNDK